MVGRLPRLPPVAEWKTAFPRSYLRLSSDSTEREFRGRILLASKRLTDEFARAIKIRPNEVILDLFAGPGRLTRSLITGGNEGVDIEEKPTGKGKGKAKENQTEHGTEPDRSDAASSTLYPKPKLVIANEPSSELLIRGFGMHREQTPEKLNYLQVPRALEAAAPVYALEEAGIPNLLVSPSTAYRWLTLPQILDNELVAPHLEVLEESESSTQGSSSASRKRSWRDPEPPITIVAQVPDATVGEQMVAQWIGSVVGDDKAGRNWIWQWGRLRMALLVGKGLYDRLLAKPGETINCKLSILANALFHISPLPPYHHVPNVDKSSTHTEARPFKPPVEKNMRPLKPRGRQKGYKSLNPPPPPPSPPPPETLIMPRMPEPYGSPKGTPLPRTMTYLSDYYPIHKTIVKDPSDPLPRPALLGVMLVPRLDSVIKHSQKDEWDFVLRKCFVREAQPIREAMKVLAFGGEGLLPRIEAEGEIGGKIYAGRPVDGGRLVRDMEIEEWQRVVDVFARWAFKPENLILDSKGEAESSRELGQD